MTIYVATSSSGGAGSLPSGGSTFQAIRNVGSGLGAWGGPAIIDASLPPYSADPSGTADAAAPINSAINALPSGGGIVWLPDGSFKCNSTVTLKAGVTLMGAAPPGGATGSGPTGPTRLFAGTSLTNLLTVSGSPIIGAGLKNLIMDGSSNVTGNTLAMTASQWGHYTDLYIVGAAGATTIGIGAVSGSSLTNHMHNSWERIALLVGSANNSQALLYAGNGSNTTSNSCYDHWEDLTITWSAAGSGVTIYGVRFRDCDNIRLHNTHFNSVSGSGTNTPIVFDYGGVTAAWPADITVDTIDMAHTEPINVGTPSAATLNRIVAISATNGTPSNPGLANLAWGYSNASP